MRSYVRLLRIDHWVKNLFVIPGVVLALAVIPGARLPSAAVLLVGLLSASLIASANYVLNEWLDAGYDRFHPVKRTRPAALGLVERRAVYALYVVVALVGIGLATLVSRPFWLTALWLLAMGVIYNVRPWRTKDRAYLDVLSESVNSPIRLLLGWFMVTADYLPPSSLVLGYWLGGAYLMAVKRFSEYRFIADKATAARYRRSFASYSEETLMLSSLTYAIAAALFVGVFLVKHRVELLLSLPLLVAVFVWYFRIGLKPHSAAQHPERLYNERAFMLFVVLAFCVTAALFFVDIPGLHWLLNAALVRTHR